MSEPKVTLFLVALISAFLAGGESVAGPPTTVPLAIVSHFPVLPAEIDGHKVRLLFDLGGDSLTLTRATLDEVGITPTGPARRGMDVKGNVTESPTFNVPRLRIGRAIFTNIAGLVDDVHGASNYGAQGFIGPSPFARYRIVLDYRDGKMTLIPPISADIVGAGCLGTAVPFVGGIAKAQTDFGDLTLVWDTGFPFSAIRKARIDQMRAKVVSNAVRTKLFRLNNVDFGPLELRPLVFSEPPGVDGFIGANFFAQHVVCFDFPGQRILIQR